MGSEKYRIESTGFDLTLVFDVETSLTSGKLCYALETPLPAGLTGKDFMGKIAHVKMFAGVSVPNISLYKMYGVVNNITESKVSNPSIGDAVMVVAEFTYRYLDAASKTVIIEYTDMSMNGTTHVVTTDIIDVTDPIEAVSSTTITLTATPNYNGTGYTKYEGSGTIQDNTNSSLVRYGILALKVGSNVYYTSVASVVSASGGTKKLTLSDYAGFSPTEVDDVDITIGKASGGSYPITVSFVVAE